MFLVKYTVTNDTNDNKIVTWDLVHTREEAEEILERKEEEIIVWNYHTRGVVSIRAGEGNIFDMVEFLNLTMDELDGMTVKMFMEIQRRILSD